MHGGVAGLIDEQLQKGTAMESDTSKEIDAKLDATRSRVEQRLMEHTMETNASFEALKAEIVSMNIAMQVQFAKIDARFDAMNGKFDAINSKFDSVNSKFDAVNSKFDAVYSKIDSVQSSFDKKLEQGIDQVVKWVIGLVGGAMIAFVTVITFVLNHAS